MSNPLRVLIVEDSEDDALLIMDELRDGGYDPSYQRVETREQMEAALETDQWDVIIADYRLPNFSGLEALEIACESRDTCPFIIVSGKISEDTAVEAMRAGAKDYILKGNLQRLVPAVERELREAEGRRQRREIQEALEAERERSHGILESITDGFYALDKDWRFTYVNGAAEQIIGQDWRSLKGRTLWEIFPYATSLPVYDELRRAMAERVPVNIERFYDRLQVWYAIRVYPYADGLAVYLRDVTSQKRAEESIETARRRAEALEAIAYAGITTTNLQELLDVFVLRMTEVMGVHSCTIWMIDEETSEFVLRAERGYHNPVGTRLPTTEGVAGIVYRERRAVYTGDAELDPLVIDRNLKEQGIKSLLSVPLIARDKIVGMALIDEKESRNFNEEEVGLLEAMASRAAQAIDNIRLFDALTRSREELEDALERERHFSLLLQRALLPEEPSINHGYDVAVEYIPYYMGREIGGDFYDVFETADGKAGIVIGDVSGKGLEAASLAAATRSTIHALVHETGSAGEALARANSILCQKQSTFESQFVTVFVTVIDLATGEINYASAGHPPAVIRRADGDVQFLKPNFHPPVCLVSGLNYVNSHDHLHPGDVLVMFTDGVAEARKGGDLFDLEGIQRTLREHGHLRVDDIAGELTAAASNWAEGHLSDDAAVVVVQRRDDT